MADKREGLAGGQFSTECLVSQTIQAEGSGSIPETRPNTAREELAKEVAFRLCDKFNLRMWHGDESKMTQASSGQVYEYVLGVIEEPCPMYVEGKFVIEFDNSEIPHCGTLSSDGQCVFKHGHEGDCRFEDEEANAPDEKPSPEFRIFKLREALKSFCDTFSPVEGMPVTLDYTMQDEIKHLVRNARAILGWEKRTA